MAMLPQYPVQEQKSASPEAASETAFAAGSFDIGLSTGEGLTSNGQCVSLKRNGGRESLISRLFLETRSDLGEIEFREPVTQAMAGPDATDVSVPWSNHPFGQGPLWTLWREKNVLHAQADLGPILSHVLSESPAYMVRPSLKTWPSGVEALGVSHDSAKLFLVRFTNVAFDPSRATTLLWETSLPAKPEGITAALAPEAVKSERHVAFVAQHEGNVFVYHAKYAAQAELSPFHSMKLAGMHLLPGTRPALFIDPTGIAHVSILAVKNNTTRACVIVEASFGTSGATIGDPKIVNIIHLAAEPVGGAILYSAKQNTIERPEQTGQLERRDVVLALGNKKLYRFRPESGLASVRIPGVPTSPIFLVPGRHNTYILYHDSEHGLYFEPIG